MNYQINEIFTSIQGEGVLAGKPATFIRLQGCTVGCEWCDTKYTWKKGGTSVSTGSIMNHIKTNHVVVTGGEPTMYDLDELFFRLRRAGKYIQLETSGQRWLKGDILPDWITWSPKERLNWRAPDQYYEHSDEVKWVVDENLTIQTVLKTYRKMKIVPRFVLMPEGCPPRPEMVVKALHWLDFDDGRYTTHWQYGDRLQYRIGVK